MIADDDPIARRLREAVWLDPASDAPRMVYADYLLEHEDPLGELISIQLDRARTGAAITEHELELITRHGRRALGPAALLLSSWVLERGFLQSAQVRYGTIPDEAAHELVWSTVERLAIEAGPEHVMLRSPMLSSLRTLHVGDRLAAQLSDQREPLPCTALASTQPFIGLGIARPETFDHRGAFDRVRALSVEAWSLDGSPSTRGVLDRRLLQQLDHLDLIFTAVHRGDVLAWRDWFDDSDLARMSVQLPLLERDARQAFGRMPSHYAYLEIEQDRDALVVQLELPTDERVEEILASVRELAADRTRVIVEDLRDSNRCAERHAALLERLTTEFADVVVTTGAVRSRAP